MLKPQQEMMFFQWSMLFLPNIPFTPVDVASFNKSLIDIPFAMDFECVILDLIVTQ
jgi:hypothetical protein